MFALGRTAFVWGFAIIIFFEGEAFLLLTFGRADEDFSTRFFAVALALATGFFFAGERLEAGFAIFFAAFFLTAGFAGFLARVRAPSVLLAFAGLRFEVVLPVDLLAI
jgi:hypothetical protein